MGPCPTIVMLHVSIKARDHKIWVRLCLLKFIVETSIGEMLQKRCETFQVTVNNL